MYNRSDMMHDQKGVVYECIEADIRPGDNWPSWQALAIPSVFTMRIRTGNSGHILKTQVH